MNLQRRNVIIGLLACVSVFFTGCVDDKDVYDPNYKLPNPMEELIVPDDFDWKTMNSMELEVKVDDKFNGQYSYLIEVFDANPVSNSGTNTIVVGYAKGNSPLLSTVTVPKGITYLYVRQNTPDGLASVRSVIVENGEKVVCDFSKSITTSRAKAVNTRAVTRADVEIPDDMFPTEAPGDAVVIDTDGWYGAGTQENPKHYIVNSSTPTLAQIGEYSNVYITGDAVVSNYSGRAGHTFYILPGKTLQFTGNWNFSTQNGTISVGEGGNLIIGGIYEMASNNRIFNKGTITINNENNSESATLHTKGTTILYNIGTLNLTGTLHNDSESTTINDGTINCSAYYMTSNSPTIENNGSVNVNGISQFEGHSTSWKNNGTWTTNTMTTTAYNDKYINSCKLIVKESLTFYQARVINDAGSFILTKDMHLENTRIDMYDESFINATGVTFAKGSRDDQGEGVYGMGSNTRSLLRMAQLTTGTDGQQHLYLSGNLQIACSDYPDQYANGQSDSPVWVLANGAEWAANDNNTVSIPSSECNDGWNTDPQPPVDPTPDPVIDPFTYSYLFEDMWPLYGDYDMNDIVLRVTNLTTYIDTDNKADKMSFEMSLRAVGAEKRIAGAVMLDKIQASDIKSVTYSAKTPQTFNVSGTGAEANQDNAVIPLFDEAHAFMNPDNPGAWFINTNKNSPQDDVANPPVVTVTIEFSTPVDAADLNAAYLNVFIITDISVGAGVPVNKSGRREIHLVDYQPTKMAGTSVFGNHNDDSSHSSGRYYRSKENLPWGIVIPDSFRWPIEYVMIQNAYGQFVEWVTSGGDTNQEWWKNPTNSGNIY